MPSFTDKVHGLLGRYLAQCRVKHMSEQSSVHVPPTSQEVVDLFAYLKLRRIEAAIIGSTAVLHYLQDLDGFRPTTDLDIWVRSSQERLAKIPPPPGWCRDTSAIGIVSWISPRGGYVDFISADYVFPGGEKVLASIKVDMSSPLGFPIATIVDIFKLKLNSFRPRDLTDLLALAKAGKTPSDEQLGTLNETQRNNLWMAKTWISSQP